MSKNLVITAILFVILGVFAAFSPEVFLAKNIYFSYLTSVPIILILCLGLLPLIIAGEFDMSFPATMAMSGFVFSYIFKASGNLALAVLVSLAFGALSGAFNALLVINAKIPSIIATIGTQFFWRGLAVVLSGGLSLSLASAEGFMKEFFVGRIAGIPAQSIIGTLLALLTYIVIFRHKFGDNILFSGDNAKAAKMLSINVARSKYLLFINMGVMSALASIILSLEFINWWPTQGDGYMLLVFAAIFIGGTGVSGGSGSVYGTLIGSIIIGIMESGIVAMGFDAFYTRVIYGAIIIVSVVIYAKFDKNSKARDI
ncbi:ABC transporter permease [Campylobacter sp. RM16187]|uniref:ABC transporter permease n=1 Tax=Campylobacter sp. RM16187 TaxID=1660063 RepID=UPI0021B6874C|nr:ABC transporter permease [Campylobacter sp. RM16187]QKG29881.1 monosaccharide ABC transporter, permease protein [Campylobacter sp. RM16187]